MKLHLTTIKFYLAIPECCQDDGTEVLSLNDMKSTMNNEDDYGSKASCSIIQSSGLASDHGSLSSVRNYNKYIPNELTARTY